MRVYDVAGKKLMYSFQAHSGGVFAIALGSNSTLYTSGADTNKQGRQEGCWKGWDVSSGRLLHATHAHGLPIVAVAVSPKEQAVATGALDGVVRVWRLP